MVTSWSSLKTAAWGFQYRDATLRMGLQQPRRASNAATRRTHHARGYSNSRVGLPMPRLHRDPSTYAQAGLDHQPRRRRRHDERRRERAAQEFIRKCRNVQRRAGIDLYANDLADLAATLLKENSALRVRDSNVTAHSLNVMAVNEDLQKRIENLECDALETGDVLSEILGVERCKDGNICHANDVALKLTVLNNQRCDSCKHWADGGTNYGTETHPIRQCCGMHSATNLGSDTNCWYGTPPEFCCANWEAK